MSRGVETNGTSGLFFSLTVSFLTSFGVFTCCSGAAAVHLCPLEEWFSGHCLFVASDPDGGFVLDPKNETKYSHRDTETNGTVWGFRFGRCFSAENSVFGGCFGAVVLHLWSLHQVVTDQGMKSTQNSLYRRRVSGREVDDHCCMCNCSSLAIPLYICTCLFLLYFGVTLFGLWIFSHTFSVWSWANGEGEKRFCEGFHPFGVKSMTWYSFLFSRWWLDAVDFTSCSGQSRSADCRGFARIYTNVSAITDDGDHIGFGSRLLFHDPLLNLSEAVHRPVRVLGVWNDYDVGECPVVTRKRPKSHTQYGN